jgi:hypothetical protein
MAFAHRSAKTGRFVIPGFARRHPHTTVKERLRPKRRRKKK